MLQYQCSQVAAQEVPVPAEVTLPDISVDGDVLSEESTFRRLEASGSLWGRHIFGPGAQYSGLGYQVQQPTVPPPCPAGH